MVNVFKFLSVPLQLARICTNLKCLQEQHFSILVSQFYKGFWLIMLLLE